MRTGTQSVERAIRLLVELSRRTTGWRLSDLARETGLDLATTHRLLRCLGDAGLVTRRAADRHFLIGPELLNLGLAAGYHLGLIGIARTTARDVAAATRHVAYVCLRSGTDFTCIARSGRGALKAFSLRFGTRRPLAASAGGAAILLRLPPAERQRVVADNLARAKEVGVQRVRSMERLLQRSQKSGFGLNRDDIVPGVTAIAVAAALPQPWSLASVLITGPSASLDDDTIDATLGVLTSAAHALEERAAALVGDAFDARPAAPARRRANNGRARG